MAKKRKGIFTRIVEGKERSEDYARKTLPSNRWALGWDLIKTNFGKNVKINLLTFLFVFPLFVLFYFRGIYLQAQAFGSVFSMNIGIAYPSYPSQNLIGVAERITFNTDVLFYLLLFVFTFLMSVGLSGGFYVMRNMVWTEGVFVVSDFWSGIKKNYGIVLRSTLLYVFFLAIILLTVDFSNILIAENSSVKWLFIILKIVGYILVAVLTIAFLFSITLGVTYKLSFFDLIKNSSILSIGLLPINAFFVVLAILPFGLLLLEETSIFFSLGLILVIFLSLSVFMLIWTNYSQWVFDEIINDKVAGAKKNRGIYKKGDVKETEQFVYKKSIFTTRPIKPITDTDVEIAILPENYSREDLLRLQESKDNMIKDSEQYAEEHLKELSDKESIDKFMGTESNKKDKK
ncbi:MAG: hypothetical protein E7358_04110 [Clostridiales bacterium]|nr:hypothetical protein [Clostridiales bacterium]